MAITLDDYMTECRDLVGKEIQRRFGHSGPHVDLYDLMLDYPLREGKALRPTLTIATCRALGGYLEAVLPTTATLELYHNAFLIHDDIEDDSLMRRGKPTLHVEHGIPIAVNVGDAMLMMSLGPLLDNVAIVGLGPALKILSAVYDMSRESVEGQAMELAWVRDNRWDLTDDDYRDMVTKKTGWYSFITPVRVGAVVAGADQEQSDALVEYVRELSIAFQITDDLLNLRSEVEEYGKEIGGDLWEGKRTLMLLHAVRTADDADRERAIEVLRMPRPSSVDSIDATIDRLVATGDMTVAARDELLALRPRRKTLADVEWLQQLIVRQGSMEHASTIARQHAVDAEALLDSLDWLAPTPHRDVLHGLVAFVHERTR